MALLRRCETLIKLFGKTVTTLRYKNNFRRLSKPNTRNYVTMNIRKPVTKNYDNDKAKQTKIFDTIQYELMQFFRDKRNDKLRKLVKMIKIYQNNTQKISTSDALILLLRDCGTILPDVEHRNRQNILKYLSVFINEKLPEPTVEHYNILLKIYAKNWEKIDPEEFLKNMKVPANLETYELLLHCAAKAGDIESASHVLSLIKEHGGLNEEVFNSLVEVYAKSGDMESALSNLKLMKEAGIEETPETLAIIAGGYATIGNFSEMYKILQNQAFNVEQIMEIVKCLSLTNNGKEIPGVLKFLPSDTNATNHSVIDTINELTLDEKAEDAYAIIDYITTKKQSDERDALLENYLKNLVLARVPVVKILQIIDDVSENKDYHLAITDVCKAALLFKEKSLAITLFEKMRNENINVRPHYYWPLLLDASKEEGEVGVFDILKHMIRLGVIPDYDTFYFWVFPYVNTLDAVCLIRKLNDIGLEPSKTATPLICYYLLQENTRQSAQLCTRYKGMIDYSKIAVPLAVAYKKNSDLANCITILKNAPRGNSCYKKFLTIMAEKVTSDTDALEHDKLIETLKTNGIFTDDLEQSQDDENNDNIYSKTRLQYPMRKSKLGIPHPQEMSLEQLECHLIQLRSKKMNTRGVIRNLLLLHCSHNNIDRVNELKQEYDREGYLWTPGMLTSLFQFYSSNGKTKEARDNYYILQKYHSHFKIDSSKILNFAIALFENKEVEEAMKILESNKGTSGKVPSKSCWNLLNKIAHSEFSEMTDKFLDILVENEYCKKKNSVLGPLVKRHLLNNDIEMAVDTFIKLAKEYHCTPLRQELIRCILKAAKDNASKKNEYLRLLEDVKNVSIQIYGQVSSTVDIFIGLASNGMREQLKELSKNEHISDQLFKHNLPYIAENERLIVLNEILDSRAYMSNTLRTTVYEELLAIYNRTNDFEKVIELQHRISKEMVNPPQDLLLAISNLLTMHKVPMNQHSNNSKRNVSRESMSLKFDE